MEQLRGWLQDHFLPIVAVAATPAAEAICQGRNGLSLVDLLRTQAHVGGLNVPMRIGEFSSRVQDIKLRLCSYTTLMQPKPEVIDEHLKEVLLLSAQKHTKMEPIPNLVQVLQSGASSAELTPWFDEYQEEFLRLMSFGEHETFDHPVACIYLLPSDVLDPVSHVEALKAQLPAPPLMATDLMFPAKDALFPKHYVLLHDTAAGADEAKVQANLAALGKAYGTNSCSILRINTDGPPGAPPDAYQAMRHAMLPGGGAGEPESRPPEPPAGLGAAVTKSDLAAAGQLLRTFTERTLLPKLEERMARLNLAISATRKGLRNRLTRMWKGAAVDSPANNAPYPWHSVESQMRQLGDLSLLLRQYEAAAAMYRLAAQDYLAMPNHKWYAGVEEMIGVCTIMDMPEGSDPVKYFGRAFEHYAKVPGRPARMLATRSMMLCAAFQAAAGRHLSAHHSLMRAHFDEDNARAALLLEQSAYALLRVAPPSARKFAFHIVLAGLRYHSCKQKRLAIHCYRQVLGAYGNQGWKFIEEHLHDILGKQCTDYGDLQGALRHAQGLLDCAHRPVAAQERYLGQFMEAVAKVQAQQGSAHPLEDLQLPLVNTSMVSVTCGDQRCFGNALARSVPSEVWSRLEGAVVGSQAPSSNWLESAKQERDHEEYNACVSSEEVAVAVTFTNPLQIKLKLSAVRLLCEFQPGRPGSGGGGSSSDGQASLHGATAAPPVPPTPDQVQVMEAKLSLHPGEVLTERLVLRPAATGWLRVLGVAWQLNEGPQGQALFDIKGRRRKRPKGDRPSQRKHYPPSRRLLFCILPGMPRLEATCDSLPTAAYEGELLRVPFVLKNVGSMALRAVRLVVDHAGVAPAASNADASMDAAAALKGGIDTIDASSSGRKAAQRRVHIFSLGSETLQLQPGASITWPMWLHVASPGPAGQLAFNCVWWYEALYPTPQMRFRTLRSAHSLGVAPLLAVTLSVVPSARDLREYVLKLAMEVAKEGDKVIIPQITCLSHTVTSNSSTTSSTTSSSQWHLGLLGPEGRPAAQPGGMTASLAPNLRLTPGERLSQFCQLHNTAAAAGAAASSAAELAVAGSSTVGGLDAVGVVPGVSGRGASEMFAVQQGPLQYFLAVACGRPAGNAANGGEDGTSTSGVQLGGQQQQQQPKQQAQQHDQQQPGQQQQQQQQQQPGQKPKQQGQEQQQGQRPVAESPVDVAVLWQVDSSSQVGGWRGPRVGALLSHDICASQRAVPVRLLLEGPREVKHDFRARSLCVVDLKLRLHNCGAAAVGAVSVKAGPGWGVLDAQHAWFTVPAAAGGPGGSRREQQQLLQQQGLGHQGLARAPGTPPGRGPLAPQQLPAAAGVPTAAAAAAAAGMAAGASSYGGASSLPGTRSTTPRSSTTPRVTADAAPGTPPHAPGTAAGAAAAGSSSPSYGAVLVAEPMQAGLPPSSEHVWCGRTCVALGALPVDGCAEVQLQVAVFRPGVYVLADYGCEYEGGGGQHKGVCAGPELLLTVRAANS